ncbi:MAG TPA: metallophosphoesterase family protein [Alphaproteobacteria bacterium]|nr:metallophosphoesterase family protein [Alphaproteobacteria bacterium]
MATFFTSDTHFGDAYVIVRSRRPFASAAAMDAALVARWNEIVGPRDDVWHLGDFAAKMPETALERLLASLAGRKHLIVGNNDPPATQRLSGWASVQHYAELNVEGKHLVLCHYPFRTWNGIYKGAWNLHGHSHGQLKKMTRQVDVGVDVWDYRPVALPQLMMRRGGRKLAA